MPTRFRQFRLVLFSSCMICLTCIRPTDAADNDSVKPNILFIMTDQHRWDCIGANGNRLIKTPNLDRLAAESANFTHFFVQAPVCVPSRASFFTGRYPHSPFEVPQPFDAMYDDIEIPLPQQMTLEEIMRLPTPLRTLILRFRPEYDTDRERLQWIYRSYYGAISHIDREVGLILDTLETTGVADNTIVVFSSDHGDQLLEHGLMGKNCFFESSVRVPFIIRFPGHIRPAQYEELVESVDLLPTLFELAGLPEPYSNQGRSLAGLIVKNRSDYVARTAVF